MLFYTYYKKNSKKKNVTISDTGMNTRLQKLSLIAGENFKNVTATWKDSLAVS